MMKVCRRAECGKSARPVRQGGIVGVMMLLEASPVILSSTVSCTAGLRKYQANGFIYAITFGNCYRQNTYFPGMISSSG